MLKLYCFLPLDLALGHHLSWARLNNFTAKFKQIRHILTENSLNNAIVYEFILNFKQERFSILEITKLPTKD